MGKLATAIEKNTARRGSMCALALVRASLTRSDVVDLDQSIAALHVPASAIARGIEEISGTKIGVSSITRHRRGECVCAR